MLFGLPHRRTGDAPLDAGASTSLGADAQALFQPRHRPPLKAVITTLVNSLSSLPADVVLVLEDYHVITAEPIHEGITYLLDHLPPHMHLVMTHVNNIFTKLGAQSHAQAVARPSAVPEPSRVLAGLGKWRPTAMGACALD